MMTKLPFLEVARQTVLLHLRSKLMWFVLGLAVVASLVLLAAPADEVRGDELMGYVIAIGGFTVLVPLVTLYLACQIVQGDIDDRTSTYLFVRPMNRASILIGKWLGTVVLGSLVAVVVTSAVYLVITVPGKEWKNGMAPDFEMWSIWTIGGFMLVCGYSAAGCLFASFFKRPMVVSILFWWGWEQLVSQLPPHAGVRTATISDAARRWIDEALMLPARSDLHELLVPKSQGFDMDRLGLPEIALLKFTVITLGMALFIYWNREYDSRPRE